MDAALCFGLVLVNETTKEGERLAVLRSGTGSITVDLRRLPRMELVFEGEVDDATFERYANELGRGIENGAPYVVLVDVTRAGPSRAKQRTMQAEILKKHEATIARQCKGVAYVASSALTRASLSVVMWLQRLPHPHVVVSTREEADRWLATRLP